MYYDNDRVGLTYKGNHWHKQNCEHFFRYLAIVLPIYCPFSSISNLAFCPFLPRVFLFPVRVMNRIDSRPTGRQTRHAQQCPERF